MSTIKRQAFLSRTPMMIRLQKNVHRRGQTLVEYALILAFISIVAIAVLINMSHNLGVLYTTINSQIERAPGGVNAAP